MLKGQADDNRGFLSLDLVYPATVEIQCLTNVALGRYATAPSSNALEYLHPSAPPPPSEP